MLISKYAVGANRVDTGGRGRILREQAGLRGLTMTAPAQLARDGVQVAIPNAATPVEIAGNLASAGRPHPRTFHAGRRETATSSRWIEVVAALHTRAVT